MGFSFKVAPGVRVRASSRGVRASVGPRGARVHFGSGRTGFSSGAGPVSFYTSLGGSQGARRGGGRQPSIASYQRQLAAAQKAEDAQRLAAAFQQILNLHRAEFPPAARPVAPSPTPPDEKEMRRRHEQAALAGIGMFKRAERAEAKKQAAIGADAELKAARQQMNELQAQWQHQLDEQWNQLCGNDPDVVLATLAEAFEDNEAPAAAVAVHGDELAVVVLAPRLEIVPERMPARTQVGKVTLRKLSKTDRAALYGEFLLGHLLVTLREVFAVALGVAAARVVVLQDAGLDAYSMPENCGMHRERLDPDGYIIPEGDLDKVQTEYLGVPQVAGEMLLERFGWRLHSGYLYGSVVRGNAVPGRPDLDLLAVLRQPPTDVDRAAAVRVAAVMQERFPLLADVGVGLTHLDEVLSLEERHGGQVFLRELSVCICGKDLRPGLPRTRPGPTVAAGFHRDTPAVLARARAELGGSTDQQVLRRACRVASRRMVQAAFAVVMARDGVWATVLEEQAAAVGEAFPEWAEAARRAAEQGRRPVADARVVAELLETFGRWAEHALEHYSS